MEIEKEKQFDVMEDGGKRYIRMLMQSPFAIAVFKGNDLIIEMANASMKLVLGKGENIENRPLLEVLPELANQPFPGYLHEAMKTGIPHTENEALCKLFRNGRLEDAYFNFVYQPYREADDTITGITCIAYEVTAQVESRIAAEKNALANSRLAAIIQSTEDAIISKSLLGIVTSWNHAAENLFGYTADEMIGQSITKLIPPDRLDEETMILKKIRAGQKVEHFETKRLTKSQKQIDISLTISPIFDSDNNIIGASKIARDITNTKQIQNAILESEHRYRDLTQNLEKIVSERTKELNRQRDFLYTIINSTPALIGAYDTKRRIIAFNKACENALGLKSEQVIGKRFEEIFPDATDSQGFHDLDRALHGETIKNEVYLSPISKRYYQNILTPLRDENGEVYAAVAIANDITEIMQYTEKIEESEEKFNRLFTAAPLGLTLSDINTGRLVDVNDVQLKMLGLTREEYLGKTSVELNLIDADVRQNIIDELKKNGSVTNYEATVRKKSGEKIPVLNSIEEVTIGNKKYYLSAIIDISERKRAEHEITQANTELQKMNKELESFTYVSSHDLQEPLRKIQTFANRLLEKEQENFSEKGKDYFRRIIESAARMQTLIEDLLAFSRINTSERKFELVNPVTIINDVIREHKEKIREKDAIIEVGPICELRVIVFQFRQIFDNLISNALKFSRPDVQLVIQINSEVISSAGLNMPVQCDKVCKIIFSDNGIGFEQQFSERIFEMFQRLHGKSEYPGTGIGLSIVKKVVETHNGRITATGVPGAGSTFEILIPVV